MSNAWLDRWAKVWPALRVALLVALGGVGVKTFGIIAPQSIINPNWNTIAWFIDIGNVTGCAIDTNNCTSATCGSAGSGIGPCLTWDEVNYKRWGCLGSPRGCPRTTDGATHTITDLSPDTNNNHPRYFYPALERGSSFVAVSPLPTPTVSASLTSVGSQWTASCAIANIRDTVNTIGTIGGFVVDTQVGASMWCVEGSTTHVCRDSIPMTNVTAPPSALQTPGLWTTAAGGAGSIGSTDTYSQYNGLVSVNWVDIKPIVSDYVGSPPTNGVFLYHQNTFDPGGVGKDVVTWGPNVVGYEVSFDRVLNIDGSTQALKEDGCVNCKAAGGLTGSRAATGHAWHWLGGTISSTASVCNPTGEGIVLDGFVSIFANCSFVQGISLGLVDTYPQVAITLTFAGETKLAGQNPGYPGILNGSDMCLQSNTLNVTSGSFQYDVSHGGCAGVFPNTGTQIFEINGSTTASSKSGNPVVETPGITQNCTNYDNAASPTSFGNIAYGPGTVIRAM